MAITRKMHILGFVIAPLIENDESNNICYKYLRIEQLDEKVHTICNLLHRARFSAAMAALYLGSSHTGAELGQSYATQVSTHGNLMTPHGYLIGPHGSIIGPSWNLQTIPNHTKPSQT